MKRININFLNKNLACVEAIEWFKSLKNDSYDIEYLVKLLFKKNKFDWIDWGILRIMNKKQNLSYATGR